MSKINSEREHQIALELSVKYGKDLLDPKKCSEIYQNLQAQKRHLQNKIDVGNTECRLGKVVSTAEENLEKISEVTTKSRVIIEEINRNLDEVDDVKKRAEVIFDKLNSAQCTVQYMRVIQHIERLNEELEREYKKRDDERCATVFANLCEVSRNLIDCPVRHLRDYLKETLHYWHEILKAKLSKDFDDVLKSIKWPFVSTNFSLIAPLESNVKKLQILAEYLLQIEIPSESSKPVVTSALLANFPPLCLPVHFLVLPLRKRFLYHFYGSRQTNRSDKPEWYFTQILTWIRDHRDFVEKWIQPVVDKLGLHHIDAKLELIRGLVQLAVEKLNSDISALQYDDFTFSHSIDEALGFDKELRETYNYPTNQPSILSVLTQAQVFIKWLTMEKKYATEKMDVMLSPSTYDAFEPLASDVDDLKITNCSDAFITLQQTITERYEALPQPGHRLQFLELQLQLFDDFRVRLLQLVNAEVGNVVESRIPMIANTIYYIENVLVDWGAMLHYLHLYYYKSQHKEGEGDTSPSLSDFDDNFLDIDDETVFSEILSLYRHFRKDLLFTLVESVVGEVKACSKRYRRERWSTLKVEKEFRSLSLTPSACPMFEVVAKRLHQLQKSLQSKLFTIIWRLIAQQLDSHLFEDLIMDNRFNEGGALQIKFDVTRNLLPLFAQFSEKPNNYFTQLIESCNLLNISKGSALLLRETLLALEGATGVEDTRGKALKEMGVSETSPQMAVRILNQRTDITVNRIVFD